MLAYSARKLASASARIPYVANLEGARCIEIRFLIR